MLIRLRNSKVSSDKIAMFFGNQSITMTRHDGMKKSGMCAESPRQGSNLQPSTSPKWVLDPIELRGVLLVSLEDQ
jgi:hypothetical protein